MDIRCSRIEKLQNQLKNSDIDYYIIPTSDFHNSEYVGDYFKIREWYSGFTGSNGTLLVADSFAGLWTDGRYFVQAEKELAGSGIELFRLGDEGVPTIPEYIYKNGKRVYVSDLTEGFCVSFTWTVCLTVVRNLRLFFYVKMILPESYGKEDLCFQGKKFLFYHQSIREEV